MGHFLWVFWGMNIQNKESKLWLKLQPHPAEAQRACGVFKGQSPPPAGLRPLLQLFLTHTSKTIPGENSELRAASCFYLKLEIYWVSFKKEEIKDVLSFPF